MSVSPLVYFWSFLILQADDGMACATLVYMFSVKAGKLHKYHNDSNKMDLKSLLLRPLFDFFIWLFWVESQRSSRRGFFSRGILQSAERRTDLNLSLQFTSRLQHCGGGSGGTHHVDANLSKLPSACFNLLCNHLGKVMSADWHLITKTRSNCVQQCQEFLRKQAVAASMR